jgi:hypothetical protein
MNDIALFFAGAFLCNCIPHLSAGLQGVPFPTPFAKPRGVGNSSPLLNFLWGAGNVVAGLAILANHPIVVGLNQDCLAIAAGALLLGTYASRHFGKVRRQQGAARSM